MKHVALATLFLIPTQSGCSDSDQPAPPVALCGNGIVDAAEMCDIAIPYPCSECFDCTQLSQDSCGNACVGRGEECDDGNTINDDECSNICLRPICGDGIVQAPETCDDGMTNGGNCPPDCRIDGAESGAGGKVGSAGAGGTGGFGGSGGSGGN
ncbi:hypothetical protein JYT22_00125 [Endomicrobium sp. AH-315-J14]|nr:hypothetical protein [Endomicrobium sp. AH-315-J14]